ncbi:hypothetical protein ACFS2C_01765 [Prauserella oleivorans]|uniref:Uncharacterized protein n=1 Tax=Prauserella oleivorans TaxID=1478153 RepID=A0ABW5W2E6_9PSEU
MLKRSVRVAWSQRLMFVMLALVFAATAALQGFLASSVSEWWPAVLAALLALAAAGCLFAALQSSND